MRENDPSILRSIMSPKGILVLIAGLLAGGTQLAAGEDRQDTGVLPPLTGVAVARALDGQGHETEWTLSVTLGKEVWHAVGRVMARQEWPEITWERIPGSTASLGTMTFPMDGSAGSALCRILDLDGRLVVQRQQLRQWVDRHE